MKNTINILGNNGSGEEDKKNIFLNTNKLPKITTRLSLSNFHKKSNNEINGISDNNNGMKNNKFNIFNRTSGNGGFKGITFNSGLTGLRSTNYKFNDLNNLNNCKLLNLNKDNFKLSISKVKIANQNNTNYKNIFNDMNSIKSLQFINNNINNINTNINDNKDKKKSHINKNTFNKKTIIHNNNKFINNININQVNNHFIIFKNNKEAKDDPKGKAKENEEKNNLCEENNDSFINELNDLFSNVKENNDSLQRFQENIDENTKNIESDDDDKEPDPRINFEQINRVNKSRPQTSYGGLNARRKNLQSALQNERNKKNRPTTSNIPE